MANIGSKARIYIHNEKIKWRSDLGDDYLEFHYNPTEWTEKFGGQWKEKKAKYAPGFWEYTNSGSRIIKCNALFNSYGIHADPRAGQYRSVNDVIEHLRRLTRGTNDKLNASEGREFGEGSGSYVGKPPTLLLVRGGRAVIRCVLQPIKVTETMFAGQTLNNNTQESYTPKRELLPVRARISMVFLEYLDSKKSIKARSVADIIAAKEAFDAKVERSSFRTVYGKAFNAGIGETGNKGKNNYLPYDQEFLGNIGRPLPHGL